MICQAETSRSKAAGYVKCEVEATHINSYGQLRCHEHSSVSDVPILSLEGQEIERQVQALEQEVAT